MSTFEDRLKWFAKRDLIKFLERAVKEEWRAAGVYNAFAQNLEAAGLNKDAGRARVISAEEQLHENDLKAMLERLRR